MKTLIQYNVKIMSMYYVATIIINRLYKYTSIYGDLFLSFYNISATRDFVGYSYGSLISEPISANNKMKIHIVIYSVYSVNNSPKYAFYIKTIKTKP